MMDFLIYFLVNKKPLHNDVQFVSEELSIFNKNGSDLMDVF